MRLSGFCFVVLVLVGLAGCAVESPVWHKEGATQDDYARNRYTCLQQSQQRVSGAYVDQNSGAAQSTVVTNGELFDACMNASGWYLRYPSELQASQSQAPKLPMTCSDAAWDAGMRGDAREAFIAKCLKGNPSSGGPWLPAQMKMAACAAAANAKAVHGDERKTFMMSCLSSSGTVEAGINTQQQKTKNCAADATSKGLKGDDRTAFMRACLSSS